MKIFFTVSAVKEVRWTRHWILLRNIQVFCPVQGRSHKYELGQRDGVRWGLPVKSTGWDAMLAYFHAIVNYFSVMNSGHTNVCCRLWGHTPVPLPSKSVPSVSFASQFMYCKFHQLDSHTFQLVWLWLLVYWCNVVCTGCFWMNS